MDRHVGAGSVGGVAWLVARDGNAGLTVAALETHGVTTKDPAAHARKASKKH